MERTLRIPRNMVRFFGALSTIVEDMDLFDPLKDHTTREFEFVPVSHLSIDQTMLDWFIRVYQMHYGYYQHISNGKDDGRDKPITSFPIDSEFPLSTLSTMISALDFYDAPLLLPYLISKIRTPLRSYRPVLIQQFPATSYLESVLKEEVWRRKTILAELRESMTNLDLVDRLTERLWPTLGPLVVGGSSFSMMITSDGLFGTGHNKMGQLGLGDEEYYPVPTRVPIENVLAVSCGIAHTMILTRDGLFACGYNSVGQLGVGHDEVRRRPTRVPIGNVLVVVCGQYHTLILTSEGLFGCGDNYYNQLGIVEDSDIDSPTRLSFENVLSMACGSYHSMVLTRDGLYACGKNTEGQLGLGRADYPEGPVRVPIENVRAVSCGVDHTMILSQEGLFACGYNTSGQLGLGDKDKRLVPTRVPLENVLAVSCGDAYTMILTRDGLFACGGNVHGELGLNDRSSRLKPVRVDINNVLSISCGDAHTMILTTDGLFVMGSNNDGQLGLGDYADRLLPTKVPLRIGYEQAMIEQAEEEEDRPTKKRRLGALLCTRCNEVGSFIDPLQRRYLFCSDRCYKDFFCM